MTRIFLKSRLEANEDSSFMRIEHPLFIDKKRLELESLYEGGQLYSFILSRSPWWRRHHSYMMNISFHMNSQSWKKDINEKGFDSFEQLFTVARQNIENYLNKMDPYTFDKEKFSHVIQKYALLNSLFVQSEPLLDAFEFSNHLQKKFYRVSSLVDETSKLISGVTDYKADTKIVSFLEKVA